MILYSTENWDIIFEKENQAFVGNCIIINKNDKKVLSELNTSEWTELGEIEKVLEKVCKNAFDATTINFAHLNNSAISDKSVSFMFIPRYNHELYFFDKRYVDKHFGENFWKYENSRFKAQKNIYNEAQILVIYQKMYDELKKMGIVEAKKTNNSSSEEAQSME